MPKTHISPETLRQEHIDGARLWSDRETMIAGLLSGKIISRFAEVGVMFGDFTQFVVETVRPENFDAFDNFAMSPAIHERLSGKSHLDFYSDRFAPLIYAGRFKIRSGDSSVELARSDERYDVIYIDADHTQEGVRKDAFAAIGKLKPQGFLIFNDYTMFDHVLREPYGIVYVVNDLCVNYGWRMTDFALQRDMFCDVALRR